MDGNTTDWKSIIYRGIESDELDYKAAQNWHELSRVGRAKFARHCIAMANTKGGYVVVGVGEDVNGQPSLFTGLDEEQSRSFDPTDVGTFINRFADPAVDFTLERPVVDGKRFVVFVIRRFHTVPHVCTSSCDSELQLGTFYIRTSDASSRPAYRSSEIHALLQRAMRNQREVLGRMIRGILYEDHSSQEDHFQETRFQEELAHSLSFFQKHRAKGAKNFFRFSISVQPSEYIAGRYNLSELEEGVRESFRLFPSPAFLSADDVKNAYSTNVSLRSLSEKHFRGWQLYESGLFHFCANLPLKDDGVSYPVIVRLFAEFAPFVAHLYDRLGFSEELLRIQVNARDVENRALTETPSGPKMSEFICRIPDIQVKSERSAADLLASPGDHATELIRKFCERFNLPAGRNAGLRKEVERILAGGA